MTLSSQDAGWLSEREICVTGARGLIGQAAVRSLASRARRVVAFGSGCAARSWPAGVTGVNGDVRDIAAVSNAVAGCSIVFHLAALTHVALSEEDPAAYRRVNVDGTEAVAVAAARAGVSTVILTSTGHVYGMPRTLPVTEAHEVAPLSAYASSKWEAERTLAAILAPSQTAWVVARLSNVYSEASSPETVIGRAVHACATTGEIRLRNLQVVRDFLHAVDVAAALIALAGRPDQTAGELVNVSSGVGVPVGTIAQLLATLGEEAGLGQIAVVEEPLVQPDVVPSLVLDNTRLRALTGWTPGVSLISGLRGALTHHLAERK